jgi:transcriptional regulator with XRE-family HTH domain
LTRPNPTVWTDPAIRQALAAHDIGAVFRALQHLGFSQATIGDLTKQSQPEVSAIVHGRRVHSLAVLARIAEGLGIPGGYLGLTCCPCPHTATTEPHLTADDPTIRMPSSA